MELTDIVGIVVAAMFGFMGYLGLFKPKSVQRAVLSYYERHPSGNPMLPLMRTDAYILILRFCGVGGALAFFTVVIGLYLRFTHSGVK